MFASRRSIQKKLVLSEVLLCIFKSSDAHSFLKQWQDANKWVGCIDGSKNAQNRTGAAGDA